MTSSQNPLSFQVSLLLAENVNFNFDAPLPNIEPASRT